MVEPYGFLHCLMLKNHYSKPKASRLTLYLYIVFMGITFTLLQFSAYPALRNSPNDTEWILYSS